MRWSSPVPCLCLWMATMAGSSSIVCAQPAPLAREAFVSQVLQTGLGARAIDAQVAVAAAARAAAGQWLNPTLSWERSAAISGQRSDETQDEFALRVPVVLSGRLGLERESAAASAVSAELHAEWARAALGRDARLAFDAVLAARARAAILAEATAAIEALGQVVAARERAGQSAGYERLRMELEAALVADLHAAAVLEQSRAESVAGEMLGAPDGVLPALQGDLSPEAPAALPSGPPAVERPDVQALSREVVAAETAARAARRRGVPDPVITAGAQWLDVAEPGRGAAYVVGVEVPLPFFDSGAPAAEVESARGRAAEAARLARVRQAEQTRALARDTLDSKRARLASHRTTVLARAERLLELALGGWKAGATEILTLLDAQRAARDARLSALELALDARNAETELVFTLGPPGARNSQTGTAK
jgi:cobalt-zinc-cadmium efflux system outer membrane protein